MIILYIPFFCYCKLPLNYDNDLVLQVFSFSQLSMFPFCHTVAVIQDDVVFLQDGSFPKENKLLEHIPRPGMSPRNPLAEFVYLHAQLPLEL